MKPTASRRWSASCGWAALTGAPFAAIHIIDQIQQHRIRGLGAPLVSTPRGVSMCRLVIESGSAIATGDASTDDRFDYASAVRGDEPVRFFAASPLEAEGHGALGTLCVW